MLPPPERCEHCEKPVGTVSFAMAPGADGKTWYLCSRCWRDGLSSKKEKVDAR